LNPAFIIIPFPLVQDEV